MNIKGHINKVIYFREDNGYVVALFDLLDSNIDEQVVITGYMDAVDKDRIYELTGDYVNHPKYGIQFKFDVAQKFVATNQEDLIKYFSSEQFKGIGKKFATVLVETLGNDLISQIKENPGILDLVPKMNEKRREGILEGLAKESDQDYVFLTSHHLSMKAILRLKRVYGDDLMAQLIENPYKVIANVDGVGFNTIDRFALSIGFGLNDLNRLIAYSEQLLMGLCMKNGDSYVLKEEFLQAINKEVQEFDGDNIITSLAMDKRIAIEEDRVYPISQYNAETYIAGYLNNFPFQSIERVNKKTIEEHLNLVQKNFGIEYVDKQYQAITNFFENDLLILTGGPGTGKTTIVRGMIELCKLVYPQYLVNLVAPTGRAAKRLVELTGAEAKTIHSLLLWDKDTGRFAKDEKDPLNLDILIVDEFSMVDQYLFYNLLKACGSLKKLILIGDADQLPSVAMGAVLRDLIESEKFTTIKLDKIYRQKEGSDIISLAYDIKNDNVEEIPTQNDIRFIECNKEDIQAITLQVVEKALNSFETLQEGFMNVQVLAPKHMGLNGINNMNVLLQKRFNPASKNKRELAIGYRTFREQDKIIQLKNQPDDDVFNGDIGVIVEIIFASEDVNHQNRIVADFDGRYVEYTSDTFANITHAYCVTVHKAQGSEYPIVILPMDNEYGIMLQKRLIYTAVSRAYKSLIFIGEKSAFYRGIKTMDHYQRKTTLKERILSYEGFDNDN